MSKNYGGFENYNPDWPNDPKNGNDWKYGCGWSCSVDYVDLPDTILEGNMIFCMWSGMYRGDVAIQQSKEIAKNIKEHLENKNFCNAFGITELIRNEKLNTILDGNN